MKNEIKKSVIEITRLLSSNDEMLWAKAFEKLGSKLDSDYESSIYSLKGFYGGMGSFNDVVLHKNGMPLIRENDELDNLRHALYNHLTQAIVELSIGKY